MHLISDLRVPTEGFELLLEVIDLMGCNKEMIKLIIKNIPENYDLKNFSRELLEEMLKIETTYKNSIRKF